MSGQSHPTGQSEPLEDLIREKALELGFAACGFSTARKLEKDAARLREWLEAGRQATMGYMERNFEKRTDPRQLVEGARTVISLLFNYYTEKEQEDPEAPVLSKYAYGKDYHLVMKEKLFALLDQVRQLIPETRGRVFVDSAPVLDRAWAREAGLGWIGRNSHLINRKYGSFVFIGELIIDQDIPHQPVIPEGDLCGSCDRCISACPTDAILPQRTIDSEKCISYQSIENRGPLPDGYARNMENRVFGCDICQDVCPWNRKAISHGEPALDPPEGLLQMSSKDWHQLTETRYEELFRDSPLERAGFARIHSTIQALKEVKKNKGSQE